MENEITKAVGNQPESEGLDLENNYKAALKRLARVAPADTLTPGDRYQELFKAVQTQGIFEDSKSFVDCVPREHTPEYILNEYRHQCGAAEFDLADFVKTHFLLPIVPASDYISDPDRSIKLHIDQLWAVLTRLPKAHPAHSSLLPLPYAYVVPGGRFTELYYWDSYFTMLGLAASGRKNLLRDMANNFGYLIDTYGHIPNGNRTYYLSRSQPPVFALMIELFESVGVKPAVHFLPQLRKEHAYWMDGADELRPGEAHRRVVRLNSGELLNRYWDDRDTPREESYAEDIHTARKGTRPVHETYRELRAAAESGWDFSSRWFAEQGGMESTCTTSILPIDLNSFLYKLETKIAELSAIDGDSTAHDDFERQAQARKTAVNRTMWSEQEGAFFDFDWTLHCMRNKLTAAAAIPLYIGLANSQQAVSLSATLRRRLLMDHGLGTTEVDSGEQWDQPNGWAPLQWMAISGLRNFGQHELANDIASRWLATVAELYQKKNKLVEKYVISGDDPEGEGGRGGEYPLQDGFGWTNGVTRMLIEQFPDHPAAQCRSGLCA